MLNCPNCGYVNAAGTAFCGGCLQPMQTLSAVMSPAAAFAAPLPVAAGARQGFSSTPAPAPVARLVVLENLQPTGQVIPLPDLAYQGRVSLGRNDLASSIVVDIDVGKYNGFDKRVSRKHACVVYDGGRLLLEDWDSKYGTYVNKVRLAAGVRQEIHPGDEIRLAELVCRLEVIV